MRATETIVLANNTSGAFTGAQNPNSIVNAGAPATVPAAAVSGGQYMVLAHGTLGTTPSVQIQDPFQNWYTVTNALAADTPQVITIPSGNVRVNLASGAAGAFVTISRIPEN